MVEDAKKEFYIDLSKSWMIGDKKSDMELADNAGIGNKIFIENKPYEEADCSFNSVSACAHYFQENEDKIKNPKQRE